MSLLKDNRHPSVHMQFDWPAYFKLFCEKHGGDPVEYKGRLLFQDGWTYSNTSYAGPEFPPPEDEDERSRIVRVYWSRKRSVIRTYLHQAQSMLRYAEELQEQKSVPLQQRAFIRDDESGKMRSVTADFDMEFLKSRIDILQTLEEECLTNLRKHQ